MNSRRRLPFGVAALALFAASACGAPPAAAVPAVEITASPTPTPSAAPTATPSPTPSPIPTPRPVGLQPAQVIMPLNEFPLTGYKVAEDGSQGQARTSWHRKFAPATVASGESWEYWWVDVRVGVYFSTGSSLMATYKCEAGTTWGQDPPQLNEEITAPRTGEATWACLHTWTAGSGGRVFEYLSATRNVLISVQANPRSLTLANAAVLDTLSRIATKQIEIIDRVAPAK